MKAKNEKLLLSIFRIIAALVIGVIAQIAGYTIDTAAILAVVTYTFLEMNSRLNEK